MHEKFKKLKSEFKADLEGLKEASGAAELKIKYLGRKSELTQLFSQIPGLPKSERGYWGKELNSFKQEIAWSLDEKSAKAAAEGDGLDLTFPAEACDAGSRHILSRVSRRICSVFENLGFAVIEGGEIEDEWHNFQALNIPLDHPSRDAFDTFYLNLDKAGTKHLLRSHTSPSQIRVMQKTKPPLAIISPGRVYRPDEVDATHSSMFFQIEGFAVQEKIDFSHLKGVLLHFAREFFSPEVKIRLRPHFFPFTEPSAEVDVSCIICGGKKQKASGDSRFTKYDSRKCSVCKGKGWLEILGCGMIHPEVLKACKIDPKKYQGFAFGMGVERIAMLKYGIDDIRLFYENDVRFLKQF